MADWQAFATAFFGDTAGYIKERKDKADDYADKLAEQAERNKGKLTALRQAADAQNSFVGQARALYASDVQIEAALDSGPEGLSKLVNTLGILKSTYGTSYNKDLVKEAAAVPEAFSPTGNLDTYSRYGLGSQAMGDTEAPTGGWFARAMGTDAKARVRAEADAEAFGGTGMSVYDMAELDGVTGYTSRNTGSYLTYNTPKLFNPSNTDTAQEGLLAREKAIRASAGYEMFDEAMADANSKAQSVVQKDAIIADLRSRQSAFLKEGMGLYIDSQKMLYGDSYVEAMGGTLLQMGLNPTNYLTKVDENPSDKKDDGTPGAKEKPITDTTSTDTLYNIGEGNTFTVLVSDVDQNESIFTFNSEGLFINPEDGTVFTPEQTKALMAAYGLSPIPLEGSAVTTGTEVTTGAEVPTDEVMDPIIKTGRNLLDGKDGDMEAYTKAYKDMMSLESPEARKAFAEAFNALEGESSLAGVIKDVAEATPGFVDSSAGKALGYSVIAANTITAGLAYAYTKLTGDRTTAAMLVSDSPRREEVANQVIAEGMAAYLQGQIDDRGLEGPNFGQNNPARARSIETQLLGGGNLDVLVNRLIQSVRDTRESVDTESDASIANLTSEVQRMGTVGFQDLGPREDVRDAKTNSGPSLLEIISKVSAERDINTPEGRIENLDKQFLADDRNYPQPAPRRFSKNEGSQADLTRGVKRMKEMLASPTSEVPQEELTRFVMQLQATFGDDRVRGEMRRLREGSVE